MVAGRLTTTPLSLPSTPPEFLVVQQVAFSCAPTPMAGVGRVAAVGEGLTPADWIDRLVVLPGLRACGACLSCRRGHAGLCARLGAAPAFASHDLIAARLVVPLDPSTGSKPGALRPRFDPSWLAALGDVGLRAYTAVILASVEPNRAAIVVGRGPLARFIAALVEHRGAAAIRVDADASANALITSELATRGIEPFAIPLIDTDGSHLDLARPGSLVVLTQPADTKLAQETIVSRALTVRGQLGAHPDLLPELVAFACAETLKLEPLVRMIDPSQINASQIDADERVPIWVAG